MMLMAEMRSWRSQAFSTGVWPDGAQVRRRTGWSMKPLSSNKTRGVRVSRAPFLSAANPAFANDGWHRRPTPSPAALASGWSSRGRGESSRRDRDGRKLETPWQLPPRPAHKSRVRCGDRPFAILPQGFLATSVSGRRSNEAWGPDGAWLSRLPFRLPAGLASNASPKIRKPLQYPSLRRFPCLPAGVVPHADGEFPTRLRFLAFS